MSRSFSHKKRNSRLMRRKPVMLIVAEGKNKTESLYFDSFRCQQSLYSIQILRLNKHNPHISFILSNPCFEVWFLQHYRFSTRPFISSDDVITELRHYLPNYKKNSNVALVINDMVNNAIDNMKKVREHLQSLGYKWPSVDMNPWTDAYIIVEQIIGKE